MAIPPLSPLDISELVVDGVSRYYSYLEPDPATPDPLPLVLAFHGGSGNMAVFANQLGFGNLPSPRPYLTVFPQGFGPAPDPASSPFPPNVPTEGVWNSGQAYVGGLGGQDDVAFFDALLVEVTRRAATSGWRIDQSKTYAVGFSNGGMMAYRLAAERSSELAAIAVMQCSIGGDPDPGDTSLPVHVNDPGLHAAQPVSVLHLHGLIDPNVPLADGLIRDDGNPRSDLPVKDAIDIWVAHNGCVRDPNLNAHPKGVLRTWPGGNQGTEVQLLTMPSVAHEVPKGVMRLIEPFLLSHRK